MRKKSNIQALFLTVIIAGGFLALWAATPAPKNSPCKESMEGCCNKNSVDNAKMGWETLPHHFFSSISLN